LEKVASSRLLVTSSSEPGSFCGCGDAGPHGGHSRSTR
jgi:hypothetical protein